MSTQALLEEDAMRYPTHRTDSLIVRRTRPKTNLEAVPVCCGCGFPCRDGYVTVADDSPEDGYSGAETYHEACR